MPEKPSGGLDAPSLEGVARDARTLADVVGGWTRAGFVGSFQTMAGARVRCLDCRSVLAASATAPIAMRRLEGASDPADMLVVAALACPVCAAHGTLVLTFGPEAPRFDDADVLRDLPEAPPPPAPQPRSPTTAAERT